MANDSGGRKDTCRMEIMEWSERQWMPGPVGERLKVCGGLMHHVAQDGLGEGRWRKLTWGPGVMISGPFLLILIQCVFKSRAMAWAWPSFVRLENGPNLAAKNVPVWNLQTQSQNQRQCHIIRLRQLARASRLCNPSSFRDSSQLT